MTSKPDIDPRLLETHDLALAALREITPAASIGPAAGYLPEEDGSLSLRFENRLPGYPGWYWTVTVARVDDEEPTVLEAELLPGDGALLAPEWVPWAERLAEYRAHQAELAEQAAAGDAESDEDDDELSPELSDEDGEDELGDDEDDAEDDDDEEDADPTAEPRVLHAGDLDGVDIDELDDSAVADDDSDDDDESDDDDSDDDDDDDDESGYDDEDDDSDEE